MIFSSNPFVFVFLPLALLAYYLAGRVSIAAANVVLVVASFVFYSYWNPWSLPILLGSVLWNYSVGAWIFAIDARRERLRLAALWIGIAGNLLLLAYYKYLFPTLGFFASHGFLEQALVLKVVLPLGISFFTFTQIGYLLDSFDGRAKERGLLSYAVFVTFFPHLIAGPILHNREILPQIADPATKRLNADNIAVGLTMFAFGMGKKVLIADHFGAQADFGFAHLDLLDARAAWITVLSYSLQLYFDFSGYSDMAIGLARMFGIVFPVNFNSPYKATSIIDFWSRWHMTLTRYLTLYLYNPIAMRVNRRRIARGLSTSRKATRNLPAFASLVMFPTFVTMGLAGVWHGAGLQFVVFGLLHATYLSINHGWRIFGRHEAKPTLWRTAAFLLLTYAAVLLAQVFFRADSCDDALVLLGRMFGLSTPDAGVMRSGPTIVVRMVLAYAVCLALPNTQQILRDYKPIIEKVTPIGGKLVITWRPTLAWAAATGALLLASLLLMSDVSKFLYFQF